ncbi:hypothetical protein Pcinc_000312 [Petrolisthes cinctipes]|uniref:Uncharacterized protein n=1 Tax=Petrolisthes cinctipes TaxID=88211 RepID=A0AAE1L5G1_PETCI|nr:hypothetical protein Pcinc_000510 [Petrolisthes cinctipes]KAK3896002.1 hypothetical protein Pcinc_000312 [Petrolisthes cinctipes]
MLMGGAYIVNVILVYINWLDQKSGSRLPVDSVKMKIIVLLSCVAVMASPLGSAIHLEQRQDGENEEIPTSDPQDLSDFLQDAIAHNETVVVEPIGADGRFTLLQHTRKFCWKGKLCWRGKGRLYCIFSSRC